MSLYFVFIIVLNLDVWLRAHVTCWSCRPQKEMTLPAAAHLSNLLGWLCPTPIIPNELSREHPNLLTKLWNRSDRFAAWWLPCLHPNQAPTDMLDISLLTTSLYMHQITDRRASLSAGQLLLPSYFIFLSNITALWRSTASVTISQTTPPSSFSSFQEDVCIVLLATETHLICSLLLPKEATLDAARRQRVWMLLSSRKAGFISSLFVCPGVEDSWQPPICLWWTSISLCWIERQRDEQVTSSAGSGKGWAIVMNIMCKYKRRETKGCFCYGNVGIGADWALIRRVCSHVEVRVHARVCAAARVIETTQWEQTFMLSSGCHIKYVNCIDNEHHSLELLERVSSKKKK